MDPHPTASRDLPPPEVVPSHSLSLAAQTDVANRAFGDYLISFAALSTDQFARMMATQGLDLSLSRHLLGPEGPLGFGYLNRTAGIARLASMGFVPGARGQGHGGRLLSLLIEESTARGEPAMTLEVFEQNLPALALYRRHGFREVTRLFGWRRVGSSTYAPSRSFPVEEIPLLQAARWPGEPDYPEIPWQVSRHAIARLAPGARAFAARHACVVLGDPTTSPVRITALLRGKDGPEGWESLRQLLAAVTRQFSGVTWFVPQVHPEPTDREVFLPLGFEREPLNQLLMIRDIR